MPLLFITTGFGLENRHSEKMMLFRMPHWRHDLKTVCTHASSYVGGVHSAMTTLRLQSVAVTWLIELVLHPTRHKTGHFRDAFPSQSLGSYLENQTKHNTERTEANAKLTETLAKNTTRNLKLHQQQQPAVGTGHMCAYDCAQLSYTTRHGIVLIIFTLNIQTVTGVPSFLSVCHNSDMMW